MAIVIPVFFSLIFYGDKNVQFWLTTLKRGMKNWFEFERNIIQYYMPYMI